jgi:hypothetical protein
MKPKDEEVSNALVVLGCAHNIARS